MSRLTSQLDDGGNIAFADSEEESISSGFDTTTEADTEFASSATPPTQKGTVKWFNDPKGFGFILDAEGRDVFVHYQTIEGVGFKTLEDGEPVLYDAEDGPKGRRATRVVRNGTASRARPR